MTLQGETFGISKKKTKEWTRPFSAWKDPAKVIELFGSKNPDPSKFFLSADNGKIFSIKDDRQISLFAGSQGGKGESLKMSYDFTHITWAVCWRQVGS